MDVNSLRTAADTKKTDTHILGLIGAGHWDQLKHGGEALLGQQSFGPGVCVGIVKNPVGGLVSLVELQKTFILADLHDRIHRSFSWRSLTPSLFSGPAVALGARALMAVGVISEADLKNAHDVREKLQQELAEILADPLEYLGSLPGQFKDQYVAKWSRFQKLNKGTDLKSQVEAGEILGDILMEVVMLIAGVVSGVGTAAKLASKAPELIKLSRVLKKARDGAALGRTIAAEGAGAGGAAKAAKATPKALGAAPEEAATAVKAAPTEPKSGRFATLERQEAKTTAPPSRPKAPPNKKGPPVLAGVSAEERALAASPGDSPAQRAARKNVTRTFLEESGRKLDRKTGYHVQMNEAEVESELVGHDFSKPVTVGPPPPCPGSQWQWQIPKGAQGQYYAERSAVPDRLGIARDGTDFSTGTVTEKVQTQFRMDPEAPYLKSTAAPAIDSWSVPGREVPTSGGDTQYVVGDRGLAAQE